MMKTLQNTLYILQEDVKLHLDRENLVIKSTKDNSEISRYPLHNLESIVSFSYSGATPKLIHKCIKENISLNFITPQGKFLGRIIGETNGNVLLRREHYRKSDNLEIQLYLSKQFIKAKFQNSIFFLKRFYNSHFNDKIKITINNLEELISQLNNIDNRFQLLGLEGYFAKEYFSVFNELILQQKDVFNFNQGRTKNPPKDFINCLLSLGYSLLVKECSSALESVGLDSYVGFLHSDVSGRHSLAFDLIEEFRTFLVDRFVISLINLNQINLSDFEIINKEEIKLISSGLKKFLTLWTKNKQKEIFHSEFQEKIKIGLLPYVQSMLLARYIRGDINNYNSFIWK